MGISNFTPEVGGTKSITTSTTSAAVQVYSVAKNQSTDIMLLNAGSEVIFVNFGNSSVAATAVNMPILGGTGVIVNQAGFTHIAARSASGTPTIYICPGHGA